MWSFFGSSKNACINCGQPATNGSYCQSCDTSIRDDDDSNANANDSNARWDAESDGL